MLQFLTSISSHYFFNKLHKYHLYHAIIYQIVHVACTDCYHFKIKVNFFLTLRNFLTNFSLKISTECTSDTNLYDRSVGEGHWAVVQHFSYGVGHRNLVLVLQRTIMDVNFRSKICPPPTIMNIHALNQDICYDFNYLRK